MLQKEKDEKKKDEESAEGVKGGIRRTPAGLKTPEKLHISGRRLLGS